MRKGTHPRTALGQTAAQMIRRYYLHDVARDSAALTYYLLFAIFPLLIFVSTLLGILELDVDSIVTGLRQIVPGDVAEVVRGYLEYVSGNASRQLMWFSLVFSIWFPMRATGCLLHSLRKAFGKGQPKNILLDQLKIFLFAIWLMVSIGLTLLMITVGRRALYFVSGIITVPDGFINLWSKLRFVAVALLMFVLVTVLYMLALGRRCPLREVAPGVAGSLAAWMLLSLAFSYYVENLAHYTQLYGSIATIVVVLLWLYMSGTVLILGGELNAVVLHRRTQRRRAAEEKAAVMALESLNPGCPVIFVSASSPSDFVTDSILIDYFEAGRILGEKAAEKNLPGEKVCLFAQGMAYNGVQDAYEGVCSVLNDQGISYELYVDKEGKAFRKVIENTVYPGTGPVEVVALDVQSLDRTASILNESSVYRDHVSALYGIGSTTGILNLLDQGIIDGLVTYDQFSQGYLSIKKAVEAIHGSRQKQETLLDPVYLDQQELASGAYEKMLYPME